MMLDNIKRKCIRQCPYHEWEVYSILPSCTLKRTEDYDYEVCKPTIICLLRNMKNNKKIKR